MSDSPHQHVIAVNAADGKSVFYNAPWVPQILPSPLGSAMNFYSNPEMLPDMSSNATVDLESSAKHSQTGVAAEKGRIVPDNGLATVVLVLNAGAAVPHHRTRTLDLGFVTEGEVTLVLDDGEERTLRKGDTFVLRGVTHAWENRTDSEVKMFGIAVDAKTITDARGNVLEEKWF